MVEKLSGAAASFIGIFNAGGEYLIELVTGIIPTLLVLLTFINLIIKLVGEERIRSFLKKCTRFAITRYTIFPVLAQIFLTDPMCHTMGRFVDEKYKIALYDCEMTILHPLTGIFPHVCPGELFIFMGIADGITHLGHDRNVLAVWYLITGIIICLVRGIVTERIFVMMSSRRKGNPRPVAAVETGQEEKGEQA